MKKLFALKDFDTFLLEKKDCKEKKESVIAKAVAEIKAEFGQTAKDFIVSTKQRGIDEIQDFIARTIKPYLAQTDGNELLYDYDSLLSGLVSWMLFELELKLDKNDKTLKG